MIVLGIDWGEKRVGIAVGDTDTGLAEPLKTIPADGAIEEIKQICLIRPIGLILVGVSEGLSATKAGQFADELRRNTPNIPISFSDETLTTHEAREKLLYKSKKVRAMKKDSTAAALMIQDWMDENRSEK